MEHHIYDKVYILGVDGAGNFFTKTDTPNIDRIFKDGAYNHYMLTAIPTISAQCWGSLLHGVTPQAHRFTNGLVGDFPVPDNFPFPSRFKVTRDAFPDATLASVSNWNPINTGIIENGLGMIKETGNDDEVCEKVCEILENNDPKLLFVQFDSVDGAGHHYGYGTEGHLRQITAVDALIGRIYDTAVRCGRMDNTLLIVTADHGGTPGGDHGDTTDGEKYVSYFVAGQSVVPGEFGEAEIRDTAAITAFAFGIEQPASWSSRIPDGLFRDGISFERPSELAKDGSKRYSGRKMLPTPTEKGKELGKFINTSTLRCYFEFDGTLTDKTGNCATNNEGKIYFTDGFYSKAAVFDDCTLNCTPVPLGTDNFTFCAWLKVNDNKSGRKMCIFSTMKDENDMGLAFFIRDDDMICEIGLGKQVIRYVRKLPGNFDGNYFHFICSYDRNCNELCYYYDFTIDSDKYSEILIPRETELNGSRTVIGCNSPLIIDDLMVFDHKLSDHEIDDLQKYYEQE